jgi:Fibronectin type III domain.
MSIFVASNNTFITKNRIMKKKLKQITFTLGVVFFSLLGFSSCDNEEPTTPTTPAEPIELIAPAAPTELKVSDITYSSATLSWAASADALVYEIAIETKSLPTSITSYKLTDLASATEYEWKIRARNGYFLYSEWVNGPTFTTEVPTTPPHWAGLEGTWTVTEDIYAGSWYNNQTSTITITGDPNDKTKIKIEGFAPYQGENHTIYATVVDMKMTLLSQELTPGWDMPDYRTYFAALTTGNFLDDAGKNFPAASITENASGKHEISLVGGLSPYSYFVYDLETATSDYAGYYYYFRNTKWVQQ